LRNTVSTVKKSQARMAWAWVVRNCCHVGQLAVPAQQRCRGDEEDRPARSGQQPRLGGQHDSVGGLELGSSYLSAEHRDLVAQDQQLDVLGAVVAGELGQHLQHLAQ
jgi:hypothetical protein